MTDMRKTPQSTAAPRRPVNAAEAARRAAQARNRDEEERYRSQAMGVPSSRAVRRGESGRTTRAMVAASLLVGALLAALAFLVLGRALLGALVYSDESPSRASESTTPVALAVTVDPDDPSASVLDAYGSSFGVSVDDEGMAVFFRMPEGGDPSEATDLIAASGTPAGMAYAGGVFFAVVNVDEGYEVWACSDSQGALATCISEGSGQVVAVKLEQDVLTLEDERGELASLSLDSDGT